MQVIDHIAERPVPRPVPRQAANALTPERAEDWVDVTARLAHRLDAGLIYSRDLPALRPALERLVAAYNRREDGAIRGLRRRGRHYVIIRPVGEERPQVGPSVAPFHVTTCGG